jgi:histidinol-phosphate/aromatic aminotransferase/cobyric acid decarboxylase-like protein
VLFNKENPYCLVYDGLMKKGIILNKQRKLLGYENCLRVIVAPRPLMDRFLDALKEVAV